MASVPVVVAESSWSWQLARVVVLGDACERASGNLAALRTGKLVQTVRMASAVYPASPSHSDTFVIRYFRYLSTAAHQRSAAAWLH